jgi:phosphoglucomutase
MLVDVPKLITAYYTEVPDPAVSAQRVVFGTSGRRGSPFKQTFNEGHILAITQAICLYRKRQGTDEHLFLGIDPHALSFPAYATALEVLAADGVEVTEDIYKIYAESFRGADHLRRILEETQTIVGEALAAAPQDPGIPSELKPKEKP